MPAKVHRAIYLDGETNLHTITYIKDGVELVETFGSKASARDADEYCRQLEKEKGCKVHIDFFDDAIRAIESNRFTKYVGPWKLITEDRYREMLGVLPPEKHLTVDGVTFFRLCEYMCGNITQHFAAYGNKYLEACRPTNVSYSSMAKDVKLVAALQPGEICQHLSPRRDGTMCNGVKLEKMPVGIRCADCAGMHHFDGTLKTTKSISECKQGCCSWESENL